METMEDKTDKWNSPDGPRQDKWENIITASVQSLEKTAAEFAVAMQASKDNVERVFDNIEKCQDARNLYRSNIEEMLVEQKEFNQEQKEITKRFDEQINGREGLFVMVGKLGQSVVDLKDTVDNYIKSTFWTVIGAGILGVAGKYFKWW